MGDLPVSAIQAADVLKALFPIWTTKTRDARRLKQRIKVVLDSAKASGFRPGDNPVDAITKVLPKVRHDGEHHAALPHAQLPQFVEELRNIEANESTKLAFEFLILTATRTCDVVGARWEEIDRAAKTWIIPGARVKAGREPRIPCDASS